MNLNKMPDSSLQEHQLKETGQNKNPDEAILREVFHLQMLSNQRIEHRHH